MVTKVKSKSDNIEFQLEGGGYGTALYQTNASVHFKPAEKSAHEKELEDQLSKETDDDRRRSLSRELDDLRVDREGGDTGAAIAGGIPPIALPVLSCGFGRSPGRLGFY